MSLSAQHDAARALVHTHLFDVVAHEAWVQHVEWDPELQRWYVRFGCDGRDAATIYFDLHQRTLRWELYFMPDPGRNHDELYGWLLRRNHTMYAARFSIGPDDDIYLTGRTGLEYLTVDELDRVIGVLYELTEQWFQAAIRIGFAK